MIPRFLKKSLQICLGSLCQTSRIKALDILRGFSVLMVVFHHGKSPVIQSLPTLHGAGGWLVWKLWQFGWTGVDLFFILSGFLIGGLLFAEADATQGIRCTRFWLRRGFKIWPSYYALLLVLGITGATGYIDWSSFGAAVKSVAWHALFLQNYCPEQPNGNTWSLAVEEHFYLMLPPLLVALAWRARKQKTDWSTSLPKLVLAVLLTCMGLRAHYVLSHGSWDAILRGHYQNMAVVYKETQFRVDALFLGVFCRYLIARRQDLLVRLNRHPLIGLTLSMLLLAPALLLNRNNPALVIFGYTAIASGYGLLLLLVSGGLLQKVERGLLFTALATVGVWSYNIYLWHPFLTSLNFLYFSDVCQGIARHVHSPNLLFCILMALFLAYSVIAGALVTRVVELPFLRLRDRLVPSPKFRGTRATAETEPSVLPPSTEAPADCSRRALGAVKG